MKTVTNEDMARRRAMDIIEQTTTDLSWTEKRLAFFNADGSLFGIVPGNHAHSGVALLCKMFNLTYQYVEVTVSYEI